jgi:hypothetical protein
MSKEKQGKFIYPCIQNVGKGNVITNTWYSNTNKRGHFGIPKLVWGKYGYNVFIDEKGEYGICEGGRALVDHVDNLPLIKEALQSKKFTDLMDYTYVGSLDKQYNHRFISLMRRDFWKEFIEE